MTDDAFEAALRAAGLVETINGWASYDWNGRPHEIMHNSQTMRLFRAIFDAGVQAGLSAPESTRAEGEKCRT